MSFNPDPTKKAKEVLFSRKKLKDIYTDVFFIEKDVHSFHFQKHFGLVLDSKLHFGKFGFLYSFLKDTLVLQGSLYFQFIKFI